MRKNSYILFILSLILFSFTMRPAMLVVGSLAPELTETFGFGMAEIGMLSTIMIAMFAVIGGIVPKLDSKIGEGNILLLSMISIIIGSLIRSYTNIIGVYIGTFVIGFGIAIINVMITVIIKRKFPDKTAFLISVYSTSMMFMCAVTPIGVNIAKSMGVTSTRHLLNIYTFIPILAIVVWMVSFYENTKIEINLEKSTALKSKISWLISIFMGFQAFIFYALASWTTEIVKSFNGTQTQADMAAVLFQFMGIPASFLAPILADKLKNKVLLTSISTSFMTIGILLILTRNISFIYLGIVITSLGIGATFSLAMLFVNICAKDSIEATEFASMMQVVSGIISMFSPFICGKIVDITGDYANGLKLLILVTVLMIIEGVFLGIEVRNRLKFLKVGE